MKRGNNDFAIFMTAVVALPLIVAVAGLGHDWIEMKAREQQARVIMLPKQSMDRFVHYPCVIGTENYSFTGYVMCEASNELMPPQVQYPSPYRPETRNDENP